VWDDDHLFFADICSPQTIANVRAGSLVEVNVVAPFVRKGYRFKGPAVICEPGSAVFGEGIERLRAAGSKLTGQAKAIVVIEVRHAAPLISPVHDDGTTTEADMLQAHQRGSPGSTNITQAGNGPSQTNRQAAVTQHSTVRYRH
jgi:hypothetical protein